jgi:hypothetical protein
LTGEQISQQQAIYRQITHLTVRLLRLVSGIGGDRPVSQVVVRYIAEASGGNPPHHVRHSTRSRSNRTPSCEGQAGIYYGAVEWTSRCPLARPPARAVGKVVRVSGQDNPSTNTLTSLPGDLRPIRDKAKGLYERIATEGYVQNEGDVAAVSGLAEDLRDALFEYRVSINPKS